MVFTVNSTDGGLLSLNTWYVYCHKCKDMMEKYESCKCVTLTTSREFTNCGNFLKTFKWGWECGYGFIPLLMISFCNLQTKFAGQWNHSHMYTVSYYYECNFHWLFSFSRFAPLLVPQNITRRSMCDVICTVNQLWDYIFSGQFEKVW